MIVALEDLEMNSERDVLIGTEIYGPNLQEVHKFFLVPIAPRQIILIQQSSKRDQSSIHRVTAGIHHTAKARV